jgi:ABC-type amino acid transport substrate-binding protein
MKPFRISLFQILVLLVLILSVYNFIQLRKQSVQGSSNNEHAVYDRVMTSKVLRVGYLIEPPYMSKNTSSGKISGIFYDVMQEIGKRLDVKIDWVEEVNLATLSEGIDNKRYDMIAFPLWRSAERSKKVTFSTPLFYSTVGCYVRADDHRFDNSLSPINTDGIKVSTIDGETGGRYCQTRFSLKHLSLRYRRYLITAKCCCRLQIKRLMSLFITGYMQTDISKRIRGH